MLQLIYTKSTITHDNQRKSSVFLSVCITFISDIMLWSAKNGIRKWVVLYLNTTIQENSHSRKISQIVTLIKCNVIDSDKTHLY